MSRIAFIDFEASGLGARSWPIEVGWAFAAGAAHSLLIRPAADWSDADWDPKAAELHRIPVTDLHERGLDPSFVCDAMSEALQSRLVYSDAPDWDSFWLMRLHAAAGRRATIVIRDLRTVIPALSETAEATIAAEAQRIAPRRHRAGCDALHLQALFRLAHGA